MSRNNKTTAPTTSRKPTSLRRSSRLMALEQRFMFDGAAVETAAELTEPHPSPLFDIPVSAQASTEMLMATARAEAEKLVMQFFNQPDSKEAAFNLFNGGQEAPSQLWLDQFSRLQQSISDHSYSIEIQFQPTSVMGNARAAFSATGTSDRPVIYLNSDFSATASLQAIQSALLEELGHAIDNRLNGNHDTPGDEGALFAAAVTADPYIDASNYERDDHQTITIDGQPLWVEASASNVVQKYIVPMAESDIYTSLRAINSSVTNKIWTVVSVTATANNTTLYYDQWEDGYDANLENSGRQSTTLAITLNAGQVYTFKNLVDITKVGTDVTSTSKYINDVARATDKYYFDGRDMISSTAAISVTRAAWADTPGTVLAGAVNVFDTSNSGTSFIVPVGPAAPTPGTTSATESMFEYSSLHIVAAEDNTRITIDKDGNSATTGDVITLTLGKGQTYLLQSGVDVGTRITASDATGGSSLKPIEVYMISGDIGATYENRWLALPASNQWGSSYYAPVFTTNTSAPAYVYLYNPDSAAITVKYDTITSQGQTITLAANSSAYVAMPSTASGAHFYTTNGKAFYAISTIDSMATKNTTFDWSYSLVPEAYLTTKFVAGWAPGNGNTPAANGSITGTNASPLWVIATQNTTLQIDYNGDGVVDATQAVKALESYRIFDTDGNQSGVAVWSNNGAMLAAAWGEDPSKAGAGTPYLDMGYTLLPYPESTITKTSTLAVDANGNGIINPGDKVGYTISVTNRSVVDLTSINIKDVIGSGISTADVVAGTPTLKIYDNTNTLLYTSTQLVDGIFNTNGLSITDDTNTASFNEGTLLRGYRLEITYQVLLPNSIVATQEVSNDVTVTSTPYGGTASSKTVTQKTNVVVSSDDGTVAFKDSTYTTDPTTLATGGTLYVQVSDQDANRTSGIDTIAVQITNNTTGEIENIVLTETGASTGIFRGTLATTTNSSYSSNNDGQLYAASGNSLKVDYTDPVYGATSDNPGNPGANANTDTLSIAVASNTKVLYLSADDNSGDTTGDLDRILPGPTGSTNEDTTLDQTTALLPTAQAVSSSYYDQFVASNTYAGSNGSESWTLKPWTETGDDASATTGNIKLVNTASSGTANYALTFGKSAGNADIQRALDLSGADTAKSVTLSFSVKAQSLTSSNENVILKISTDGGVTFNAITSGSLSNSSRLNFSSSTGAFSQSSGTTKTGSGTYSVDIKSLVASATDKSNIVIKFDGNNLSNSSSYSSAYSFQVDNFKIDFTKTGAGTAVVPAEFSQSIPMASDFSMPTGGQINILTYISSVSSLGSAGAVNVAATLGYEDSAGTYTAITSWSSATYSSANGTLQWSYTLPSGVTVPEGCNVVLKVTNNVAGSSFKIDYDSNTKQSRIELPTTTVIGIADADATATGLQQVGFYSTPYSNDGDNTNDGTLQSSTDAGNTVYVRVKVTDPFGDYDINGLTLTIRDANGTVVGTQNLTDADVVDDAGDAAQLYEYAWTTALPSGFYTVTAKAAEGFETTSGNPTISATGSSTFYVNVLDTGSPSITEFINSDGTVAGATYDPGVTGRLRVTDADEASANAAKTVTAKVNGQTYTLTQTGANTGVFEVSLGSVSAGTVLSASYTDPTDPTDSSSDTISVPSPGNTAPVATNNSRAITENTTASGTNLISSNEGGSGVDCRCSQRAILWRRVLHHAAFRRFAVGEF